MSERRHKWSVLMVYQWAWPDPEDCTQSPSHTGCCESPMLIPCRRWTRLSRNGPLLHHESLRFNAAMAVARVPHNHWGYLDTCLNRATRDPMVPCAHTVTQVYRSPRVAVSGSLYEDVICTP